MGILVPRLPGSRLPPSWSPAQAHCLPVTSPLNNCLGCVLSAESPPLPMVGRLFLGAGRHSKEQGAVSGAVPDGSEPVGGRAGEQRETPSPSLATHLPWEASPAPR